MKPLRIAIINNGKSYPEKVARLVGGTPDVFSREEASEVRPENYDLLLLTGSNQLPIIYNEKELSAELNLIKNDHSTPLIGICYGCELIAHAFGGTLKDRGENTQIRRPIEIQVTKPASFFLGNTKFQGYDAHRWIIDTLPETFEILAISEHGPEIIRHKTLPIFGFQFHPEKMTDETLGDDIFQALLQDIFSKKD